MSLCWRPLRRGPGGQGPCDQTGPSPACLPELRHAFTTWGLTLDVFLWELGSA